MCTGKGLNPFSPHQSPGQGCRFKDGGDRLPVPSTAHHGGPALLHARPEKGREVSAWDRPLRKCHC